MSLTVKDATHSDKDNNKLSHHLKCIIMKSHQFRLIDSTYGIEDAREVLLSLVCDKIRFLKQKIFSLEERFGSDTTALKKRVAELEAEQDFLRNHFSSLQGEEAEIEISCEVRMNIHHNESLDA